MGKLVVGTFVTLDGVMQAPGGPDEDRDGGFEHGGWLVPYFDEGMGAVMDDWMGRNDALLLGRRTYEIFAAHWPRMPEDDPMAARLNSAQKYVASRTLGSLEWRNSTLLEGDAAEAVATLKRDDSIGEIGVAGSANLVQTLLRHDLVDEFRLMVFPVVLGTGKRLFDDGTIPRGLQLVESKTSGTGVAIQTYERAGELDYGSFALDD